MTRLPIRGCPRTCCPRSPCPPKPGPIPSCPVVQSVSEPPERDAGRAGVRRADRGGAPIRAASSPYCQPRKAPRVPLLELADVRGGPIMARGRGAPLDLRIFVGGGAVDPAPCPRNPWPAGGNGARAPGLPVPQRVDEGATLAGDSRGATPGAGLPDSGRLPQRAGGTFTAGYPSGWLAGSATARDWMTWC